MRQKKKKKKGETHSHTFSHNPPFGEESCTSKKKKNPSQGAPFNRASISSACLKKPLVCAFALRGHTAVQASRSSGGVFFPQCTQRGANPDVSPPFFWERKRAHEAQLGTSPWLGQAAVFYQCWPAALLVAPATAASGSSSKSLFFVISGQQT